MCDGKMDNTLATVASSDSNDGGFANHTENYDVLDTSNSKAMFRHGSMDESMDSLSNSTGKRIARRRSQQHLYTASGSRRGCMIVRTQEESLNSSLCETAKKERRSRLSHINGGKASASVRFERMTVNWYPMIMGDNPSGTKGPPMTIDWDPLHTSECLIDNYEREKIKRNPGEMIMPSEYRFEYLVRQQDVTKKEIMQNEKRIRAARIQRFETRSTWYMFKKEERKEMLFRKMKNLVLSGKKKKERQFIAMSKEIHEAQRLEADKVAKESKIVIIAEETDNDLTDATGSTRSISSEQYWPY